jgi:hypothetical protein
MSVDIEELITTWTAFGGLTKEEQEFLKKHQNKVKVVCEDGTLLFLNSYGWHLNSIYRLSPDFQMPIEPPNGYRIVSMNARKRCKYPRDCEVMWYDKYSTFWMRSTSSCMWGSGDKIIFAVPSGYVFAEDRPKERWYFNCKHPEYGIHIDSDLEPWSDRFGWIEITEAEKKYLETKPEPVEGYEWVLKVPSCGESYINITKKRFFTMGNQTEGNHFNAINGICWTLVKKEHGWRDGWAQVNGVEIKAKVRV